ncbi:MAG TPA: metallophosphoesterase [Bryobacteraceae bacterium]|nr:metallophosphoesterase [Bryobacteraceae bacterium]
MRTSLICLGLAVLFAGSNSGAEEKLAGGPYVVNVTQRAATLAWVVDTGSAVLTTGAGQTVKSSPALRVEKTNFTGLQPGTTYQYEVPGHAEARGSFKTAPAPGAPFQFVAYGDTRTRNDVHRKVVAAILKYASPDFIVQSGDMVADGSDSSLWPTFFDIESPLLRKAAYFPALGNHERNDSYFYEFFSPRAYYSFNWGNAHFAVMDSDVPNVAPDASARDAFWTAETRWLEDDLAGSQKAEFRFVVAHHPPLTAVERRQDDNPHMKALMPMFEKYKVTAGLFGHDHNYQHYLRNGVHYFISGGGGAPLYDVNSPPAGITQKVVSTENFMIFKVDGKKLRVQVLDPEGETIDVTDIAH